MADSATKRSTAKKASAKKSTAKKSTSNTSTSKKSTAKKSTANKSTDEAATRKTNDQDANTERSSSSKRTAAKAPPPRSGGTGTDRRSPGRGTRVAAAAREAVLDLTGKRAEAVTGLDRSDDGWTVEVEVLELARIPSTTDVLATYQVTMDDDGELQGCRRVRRYLRGSPHDD